MKAALFGCCKTSSDGAYHIGVWQELGLWEVVLKIGWKWYVAVKNTLEMGLVGSGIGGGGLSKMVGGWLHKHMGVGPKIDLWEITTHATTPHHYDTSFSH